MFKTADDMLEHMAKLLCEAAPRHTDVYLEMEKAVLKAFEVHCSRKIEKETEEIASDRGEKTYIFPWDDTDGYVELVGDRRKFKTEVAEFPEKKRDLCGYSSKPSRKGAKTQSAVFENLSILASLRLCVRIKYVSASQPHRSKILR